jgi:hypothetical protein
VRLRVLVTARLGSCRQTCMAIKGRALRGGSDLHAMALECSSGERDVSQARLLLKTPQHHIETGQWGRPRAG